MALRVLLVDESATIKRVFKLALQDYGVQIFTLPIDGDIFPAIGQLKPDILFIDVLLKKKSGYEMSQKLKTQSDSSKLPIVLLWSHFIKLDESKFESSKADFHLEKPFSINSLRKIIHNFVPKTKTQNLSPHLEFPKINESDFSLSPPSDPPPSSSSSSSVSPLSSASPSSSLQSTSPTSPTPSSSEPEEKREKSEKETEELSLRNTEGISLEETSSESDSEDLLPLEEEEDWVQKNVFKIEEPSLLEEERKSEEEDLFSEDASDELNDELNDNLKVLQSQADRDKEDTHASSPSNSQKRYQTQKEEKMVKKNEEISSESHELKLSEEALYSQSKKIIESIVWQVVPELATQIIEKEVQRLLAEKDQEI